MLFLESSQLLMAFSYKDLYNHISTGGY